MTQNARDEILEKLKAAPKKAIPPRPAMPPLNELLWSREEMVQIFSAYLAEETGIVYRTRNNQEALDKLAQIAREEGLEQIMVSTDEVVAPLNLPEWGKRNNIRVMTPGEFADRESFKDAVFEKVQAGISGVDFAVAESGSVILLHNKDQARLVSLAPPLHIAFVPVERIIPIYESAIEKVFNQREKIPSQICFITGPSMTADIQATPFKGMHGPKRLIAILVG